MDKEKIIENLNEIENFICDVNPIEINSQIAFGELDEWCNAWQRAINACLNKIKEVL